MNKTTNSFSVKAKSLLMECKQTHEHTKEEIT